MPSVVGFVGAGQMGEPMVIRLLAAGHEVHVYARKDAVADRLRARGAHSAPSVAALGSCDVVFCTLFSDAQLEDVALGSGGLIAAMKAGSTLVSHTTGSAETIRRLADAGEAVGVGVIDAPISGTAEEILAGTLTVLLGGAPEPIDTVVPILDSYARHMIRTGRLGSAVNVKLINNLLFAANLQLVADAARIGDELGIEPEGLLGAIQHCSGSSSATARVVEVGGLLNFVDRARPFLRKDIAVCLDAVRDSGAQKGVLGRVAVEGPLDFSAVPPR
ncbi:NAD(P)-dependent oxidoreductase [Williamsia muralis]|uniref:NAD(P)-dependent oxidoreductase n=1 Tax=Williamsia marianensis TaxID=85044 RepID=A0ABU4EYZ1_WILMA|nr:NAD(P)-dependent oxidoreductase [Williamsia muralis]MDV7136456.1 NAD(P)-dependent oxidoreductase [Williamsia muralis]